ncbi:hypothetical protein GLYMA_04G088350v4 [Glycine max]|nr:hypothetical protein GLYMA_04G088350v4 [Glycine max]KAH1110505.1 hypothetical protein GYH30_009376 [Glycine max]
MVEPGFLSKASCVIACSLLVSTIIDTTCSHLAAHYTAAIDCRRGAVQEH